MIPDAPDPCPIGMWRMSAERYHRDPTPGISLSASLAHVLLTQSAAHAAYKHPKLRPVDAEPEESRRMDLGTLAHALLLGEGRDIVSIDSWEKALRSLLQTEV